jgi:hypothetical protein
MDAMIRLIIPLVFAVFGVATLVASVPFEDKRVQQGNAFMAFLQAAQAQQSAQAGGAEARPDAPR